MGLFNKTCCPVAPDAPVAVSSGTLTGTGYTVPAGARSVTLLIHSSGGVAVTGEVNATFSWAGSSRTWSAKADIGSDLAFVNSFDFTPGSSQVVYEVNWSK